MTPSSASRWTTSTFGIDEAEDRGAEQHARQQLAEDGRLADGLGQGPAELRRRQDGDEEPQELGNAQMIHQLSLSTCNLDHPRTALSRRQVIPGASSGLVVSSEFAGADEQAALPAAAVRDEELQIKLVLGDGMTGVELHRTG